MDCLVNNGKLEPEGTVEDGTVNEVQVGPGSEARTSDAQDAQAENWSSEDDTATTWQRSTFNVEPGNRLLS